MKYHRIYLGAWKLGSTLHLKELYQALAYGKAAHFDDAEIRLWRKGLKPVRLRYNTDAINSVSGSFENEIDFDVMEDGIMILSKDVEDLNRDIKKMDNFMDKKFYIFRRRLASKDAGLPREIEEKKPINPIVLHVSRAKQSELEGLFLSMEMIANKKIKLEKGDVWIGDSLVVINNIKLSESDLAETVRYLMFARVFELKLRWLLHVQRILWRKIDKVRKTRYYRSSELAGVRDQIFIIQSQANFFKSLSRQMNQFLTWREKLIGEYLTDHVLSSIFRGFFLSLKSTQKYLLELWDMTATHADSTVQQISLMYSNNQQRELRTLQKLFLISAVISILSLGSIAGSDIVTKNGMGEIISTAKLSSWHLNSFIFYGSIAFLASLFVYFIFYLLFSEFIQPRRILSEDEKEEV